MVSLPAFSIKAFIITLLMLLLMAGGTITALTTKTEMKKSSQNEKTLHSVIVPLAINTEKPETQKVEDNEQYAEQTSVEQKPLQTSKGIISLVIYDYGLSTSYSQKVIESEITGLTLSLSPYAERATYWIDTARQFGHEPWSSLYIASKSSQNDYGPLSINTKEKKELNQKRIDVNLEHSSQVNGVMVYYDAPKPLKELVWAKEAIDTAGINAILISTSQYIDGSILSSNLWLEYNTRQEKIDQFLDTLAIQAEKNGYAFGAVPPTPAILNAITSWKEKIEAKQLTLAPLSTLMKVSQK